MATTPPRTPLHLTATLLTATDHAWSAFLATYSE